MRVDDGAFDVVEVGVMLQGALKQSRLLAQLSHVSFVVVGEHLVAQDSIRNLNKYEMKRNLFARTNVSSRISVTDIPSHYFVLPFSVEVTVGS